MKELTYEETLELEKNVKLTKQANDIYAKFLKRVWLSPASYNDGRFKIWSDSHNATYLKPTENGFIYQCRYLHESYDVYVNPGNIFGYLKENYRGVEHFISWVEHYK